MDRFTQSWLARSASWLVPKEYESAIKENSQQHIQETLQHYEYSKLLEFLQNQIDKNTDGIANISIAAGPLCNDLTDEQKTVWSQVTHTINKQFKDSGIAIRFDLQNNQANDTDVNKNASNYPPHSILLEHCNNSQPMQHRDASSHHIFNMPTHLSNEEGSRELALYLRTYLHVSRNDTAVLEQLRDPLHTYKNLHPDVRESMCNPIAHDFDTTSILSTKQQCIDHGYIERAFIFGERSEKLGYFDEGAIKCIFPDSIEGYELCVNQTTEAVYQWIENNYSAKVASSFSAAFIKEITQQVLMNGVARLDLSTEQRDIALASVKIISSLLQCSVLVGGGLPLVATATMMTAAELSGSKTLQSMTNLLGEANLLQLMLQLMRGNSFALIAIGTAFAGKYAGFAVGEGLNQIFDCFVAMTKQQRKHHLEALNQLPGFITHSPLSHAAQYVAKQTPESVQTFLKSAATTLTTWDKTLAMGVERYVNLRCLTSYLWRVEEESSAEHEIMKKLDTVMSLNNLIVDDSSDSLVESTELSSNYGTGFNSHQTEDVM
jgi:hypothetical protein